MLIKFVSQQRPPSQSWYMRSGKGLTEGPYRTALGTPRTGRGHAGHPQRPRQGGTFGLPTRGRSARLTKLARDRMDDLRWALTFA
jgi:hypothetical protein